MINGTLLFKLDFCPTIQVRCKLYLFSLLHLSLYFTFCVLFQYILSFVGVPLGVQNIKNKRWDTDILVFINIFIHLE